MMRASALHRRAGRPPAPRQKLPEISPIFKADTVTLHVSREKDGKLRLGYAGIRRSFSRTAAGTPL
jgi:hypothetical protein